MTTANVQAIFGVSASSENEIMSVFPSIGSIGLGRLLGSLFESIPLGNSPVKLSHLLFALPLSPIAALMYVYLKVAGARYMLTNRALVVKSVVGGNEIRRVDLAAIGDVALRPLPGQAFYHCADLTLMGSDGTALLNLEGVPRADIFRETILEARDASAQVRASLATIDARHA